MYDVADTCPPSDTSSHCIEQGTKWVTLTDLPLQSIVNPSESFKKGRGTMKGARSAGTKKGGGIKKGTGTMKGARTKKGAGAKKGTGTKKGARIKKDGGAMKGARTKKGAGTKKGGKSFVFILWRLKHLIEKVVPTHSRNLLWKQMTRVDAYLGSLSNERKKIPCKNGQYLCQISIIF